MKSRIPSILELIDALGGAEKVAESLGLDKLAVYMWMYRGRIPAPYLLTLYKLSKGKRIGAGEGQPITALMLLQIVSKVRPCKARERA